MVIYIVLFAFVMLVGIFQYSTTTFKIRTTKDYYVTGTFIAFVLTFLSMSFIEAMRSPRVGEDLVGYLLWFRYYRLKPLNLETLLDFSAFEPGFMLLYKGIGLISTTDHAFIVVTSIIIVFLNMLFLYKNSDDFFLSVLLFLGFNHFFTSMVSLRQYIAIGIVMWVLPSLRNNKVIKAVTLSIIAFFFHQTSIIAVAFIVLAHLVRNYKKVIPWVALSGVVILPFAKQLFTFITRYFLKYQLNYSIKSGGSIGKLRLIYVLLEVVLIFYIYNKKEFDNEEYTTYSILLIPAVACGILTSIPWIFRIGYYFDYYMLLLIPKIVSDSTKNKLLMRLIVVLVATAFFVYYLSVNPGQTVPYEFY